MRNFYTVVLERMRTYSEDFATEPYETGWAGEAMFFIRIHEMTGKKVSLEARVQVSVDGINWVDEGTRFSPTNSTGEHFIKVTHFGGWFCIAGVCPHSAGSSLRFICRHWYSVGVCSHDRFHTGLRRAAERRANCQT